VKGKRAHGKGKTTRSTASDLAKEGAKGLVPSKLSLKSPPKYTFPMNYDLQRCIGATIENLIAAGFSPTRSMALAFSFDEESGGTKLGRMSGL